MLVPTATTSVAIDGGGERRAAPQDAQREPGVADQSIEPGETPDVTRVFLDRRDIAKAAAGNTRRGRGISADGQLIALEHAAVKAKLLVELAGQAVAVPPIGDAAKQVVHGLRLSLEKGCCDW